ncbi:MAG: hypothetical protein P8Y71_16545 [Pseudolabrys sp.]
MKFFLMASATALAVMLGSAPAALAYSSGSSSSSQWGSGGGWGGWGPYYGYGWRGPWMMGPHSRWMMMHGGPGWMMGRGPGSMARAHGRFGQSRELQRGAHFRFVRGNARIDIQCPAGKSMQDCVDAASTLIDKVAKLHTTIPAPATANRPGGPGEPGAPNPGGRTQRSPDR